MASFSLWLAAPRVEDEEVERETESMTKEERSELERDLYGDDVRRPRRSGGTDPPRDGDGDGDGADRDPGPGPSSPPETSETSATSPPPPTESDLADLDDAVSLLGSDQREALAEAERRSPALAEESKLFFLRCRCSPPPPDDGGARGTAERLCRYWERRRRVFGAEEAYLPLARDGSGGSRVIPDEILAGLVRPMGFDGCGRMVFIQDFSSHLKHYSINDVVKHHWRTFEVNTRDMPRPSAGVVLVLWTKKDLDADDYNRKRLRETISLWKTLPVEFRAVHLVQPPWFYDVVKPVANFMMGPRLRARFKTHRGSTGEVLDSLAEYGITRDNIPVELGGSAGAASTGVGVGSTGSGVGVGGSTGSVSTGG